MPLFKCKMCGGALEISHNETVATCEYCGTQQTLPKLDDDRRANLYDRANHFRRNNEFDKAMGIYEQILNEDSADAEAYWSLVLCRYGIEYVEDPSSRKRVPTVNRAQFTSVFDDDNYKSALQYADGYQKAVYEAEAKAINEIQKGILAISQKEEPFDVFICYKESDNNGRRTPDSVLANDLYHQLTQEGFKVFFARITLEDKLGSAYEPYIFAALNSAKVMVVLGTKAEYFNAVWVKNEWSRYLSLIKQGQKKMLIPAYKDMDPYDLPEEFSHLQAQDMTKLGFMQDLIRGIKKIAASDEPKQTVVKETVVASANASAAPLLKRAFMFLEDGEWQKADEFCEQVLNLDPECAEAYLGKLMADLKVRKQDGLQKLEETFDNNDNYAKCIRFGNEELRVSLLNYNKEIEYNNALEKIAEATTEREIDKAIKLLESCKDYKDSGELIATAKETFLKKKERFEELLSQCKKLSSQKDLAFKEKEIEKSISMMKHSEKQLEALQKSFPETSRKIADTQNEVTTKKERIQFLQAEREKLGIFAGKRKKEIDAEISSLQQQISRLEIENRKLTKELGGCTSILQIQTKLDKQKAQIASKESELQKFREDLKAIDSIDSVAAELISKELIWLSQKSTEARRLRPLIRHRLKQAAVGDVVLFGRYKQNNDSSIDEEDVEWLVLAKEGNKVLVISKYALDCQQYNTSSTKVTWETCLLRKWLNGTFINNAFSAEEQAMIPTVTVSADKNPKYSTNPGETTQDKVFLLSITEADHYFASDEARKCAPTDYAIAQGARTSDSNQAGGRATCWWWLRSPGITQYDAADVRDGGGVYESGNFVYNVDIAVRPAMWIDLNA